MNTMQPAQPITDPALLSGAHEAGAAAGSFLAYLLIWTVAIGIVFAFICAGMAQRRGRSSAAGAVAGFCFGLLAVAYYAMVGNTVEMRVRKEEQARLRMALTARDEAQLCSKRVEAR